MYSDLTQLLSTNGKKLLFVGLGNPLKRDDGTGVYISSRIKSRRNILVLTAETGIENYIGKINSLRPDILVLIDCAEMKSAPGTYRLLPVSAFNDLTFNTHTISLKRISEFFHMPVYVLGIQPESIDFGEEISYLLLQAATKILKSINGEEEQHGS